MIDLPHLQALITKHEGLRLKPYWDNAEPPRCTIGIGRNLTDRGISVSEAEQLLADDLFECQDQLRSQWPTWLRLDDVRQAVLVDMVFNMGIGGVLQFHQFLAFVAAGNFAAAAADLMSTLWAKQVGPRAVEDAAMMASGQWPAGVPNA